MPSIATIFPGERAVDFTTLLAKSRIAEPLGAVCIAACAGFTLLATPNIGAAIPVACPTVLPPRANARWSIGNSDSSRYPIPPATKASLIDSLPPIGASDGCIKSSGTPNASNPVSALSTKKLTRSTGAPNVSASMPTLKPFAPADTCCVIVDGWLNLSNSCKAAIAFALLSPSSFPSSIARTIAAASDLLFMYDIILSKSIQ